MSGPIIILSHPQMGENIGAAARVMANFGLSELRLVKPRDGWPNPAAEAMAAGGAPLVAAAKIYETSREAVADCQRVLAATARDRAMMRPVVTPREAFARNDEVKTAILFGCEKSGLDNDEVALAEAVLSIPVDPACASLNLGMAVGVVAYEWFGTAARDESAEAKDEDSEGIAPQSELHGFFDQLEAELDRRNFWKEPKKKPVMWRNIRGLYLRAQPSSQEVRTLRGLLRCLTEF